MIEWNLIEQDTIFSSGKDYLICGNTQRGGYDIIYCDDENQFYIRNTGHSCQPDDTRNLEDIKEYYKFYTEINLP